MQGLHQAGKSVESEATGVVPVKFADIPWQAHERRIAATGGRLLALRNTW
jgi:hypothetical protein